MKKIDFKSKMEAETIQNNAASTKSRMSRKSGNIFLYAVFAVLSGFLVFNSCNKNSDDPPLPPSPQTITLSEIKSVNILPDKTSTVAISDGIDLSVESGTFTLNTEISYAIAKNIPLTNDTELEITGKPILLSFPISTAKKGMTLSMPLKSGFDRSKAIFFVSDGTDVFPLFYKIENNVIKIDMDLRSWTKYWDESTVKSYAAGLSTKVGTKLGDYLILMIANSDKDIPSNMKGLKIPVKPIFGKKFTDALPHKYITQFDAINSIEANENALLFIHGWGGSPESTWWDFLESIENSKNGANDLNGQYSKILTFGYNSALHIKANGELLAAEIKKINKGVKNIDIVVHSMGGLVARVAIEKYGCDKYVRKFITLGTPHKGSPLGAYRNWLLADKEKELEEIQNKVYTFPLVGEGTNSMPAFEITVKNQDIAIYKLNTYGFADLDANSDFITKYINPPNISSDIRYTTVGVTATGNLLGFLTEVINPPHDGVVELSSALGLPKNSNVKEKVFEIEGIVGRVIPHMQLTEDSDVLKYTFAELKETTTTVDGLVAYYPFNGNANDESGNGNHGLVNGATLTTDRHGNANSAYYFDGSNDFIEVQNSETLKALTDNLSMSVWIKSSNGMFVPLCKSAVNNHPIHFRIAGQSSVMSLINCGTNMAYNTNLPLNEWIHLVSVTNNGVFKLFVNNCEIVDYSSGASYPFSIDNNLFIGSDPHGDMEYHQGEIDNIRIYNRALTESEIQALYRESGSGGGSW